MTAWLTANAAEVLQEIPGNYAELIVDSYPMADQSSTYATVAEEAEKQDSQLASKKLVLCFVDTESKLQTVDPGRYLEQTDNSRENKELKQKIENLQATLDQLTESLQRENEEVSASDDPYSEYPDQFSEKYSYLDER